MKLLIGGSSSKIFHLKEFGKELETIGIKCKILMDSEIYDGFPSRKIQNWFQSKKKFNSIINEFHPDAILIDRQRHFGLAAIKSNIPLLVHVRGDFWSEIKWAKETIYKTFPKNIAIKQWEKIGNECFRNASMILPICKYLEDRVKEHVPNSKTAIMYQGINPKNWFQTKGMKLKHPCVGILQSATIWGKIKEMLILPKILEANPEITFYWVGDGAYREKILPILSKFKNFTWLGSMNYPDQVREFLDEIDVYGLISGIDMSPLTLQEAQLMKKPVLATNVGGIPELMKDKETGFLIEKGDHKEWIDKISYLLNDEKTAHQMGLSGRKFIEENFSWNIIAKKFVNDVQKELNLK
jgi:glycosyltransferase involved in cell wall biosynthesis